MAYEPLSLEGFLQEIKEVTHSSHPRKFCFVLGAGASRSSGIPSGQELVRIWDRELRTPQSPGPWALAGWLGNHRRKYVQLLQPVL